MLARNKLNSVEIKISEALTNNEISHKDFMTIINEERNSRRLTESITMMTDDTGKTYLIEEGNKIGIYEIIKHDEIINNSLKSKI